MRKAGRNAPGSARALAVAGSQKSGEPLGSTREAFAAGLPLPALDERIAIVGTSGSGKTYAAKGLVEQLLDQQARVCVVDPLGVWWGLRAAADGAGPGYPIVVFGGRHADVPISEASQADILVMMKLTSSQDREAVGRWLEGQGDRADGRRILVELPRLARGGATSGRPRATC